MPKSLNFLVLRQYCVPQHLLSRLIRILAECRWEWFKNWAIKRLIRLHNVDKSEALSDNLDDYPTFNSFFTRRLKPELRPIAQGEKAIACPVDGCVSQAGDIRQDTIFQAKNFDYSAKTLLGGDDNDAALFQNGKFATLYLAPRDYHRVHIPLDGKLIKSIYVPGKLFSVNQETAAAVPNLFARNERLITLFETAAGPMAVILVGAMLVSSIKTAWPCEHPRNRVSIQHYVDNISLKRGEELGHFEMGSTVILLFGHNKISWESGLKENAPVKMGQLIGNLI